MQFIAITLSVILFSIGLMMIFKKLEQFITDIFDKIDVVKIMGMILCIFSLILLYFIISK